MGLPERPQQHRRSHWRAGGATSALPPPPSPTGGSLPLQSFPASYFMIGLPGETDEDVLGIAETIAWLQQEVRQGKWHLAVNTTIRQARRRLVGVPGAAGRDTCCALG